MSREIKFRAWHANTHRLLYFNIQNDYKNGVVELNHILLTDRNDWIPMQYTGLKDKTGKEIYEGDLVKWTDELGENPNIFKVAYETAQWVIVPISDPVLGWYIGEKELEIIGNVYENPELVQQKKLAPN
jgi:uncharacterized phage protein (TIGR01671 family)